MIWGWEGKILVKVLLLCINFQGSCLSTEKNIQRVQFIKENNKKWKQYFSKEIEKGPQHLNP